MEKKDWWTYTWLPVKEAARLEDISEKVMRNHLREGKCIYKWRLGLNGEKEICLSSLGGEAILRYEEEELPEVEKLPSREDPVEFINLFNNATAYSQWLCTHWTKILLACEGLRGTKVLTDFVNWWNANHPKEKEQISVQRLYKVRQEYEASGYNRTIFLKGRHIPQSSVKDEWFEDFKQCYLRQQRPSGFDARLYALGKARQRGEDVNIDNFPSLSSFMRRTEKLGGGIKTWFRKGQKGFYDRESLYIQKDYSKVQAGWSWVGDTRIWDILVMCPGFDSPKRPYITMFVDEVTDMPMGWHIHFTPPSAANVLMALRNGIKHHGKPNLIQVDNGREFRNKDFSGNPRGSNNWGAKTGEVNKVNTELSEEKDGVNYIEDNAAALLNIRVKFKIVHNARAKTVENSFGVYKKIIDKSFVAYFGGNSVERPEQVKEIFKSKKGILDFAEFKKVIDRNLLNIIPNYPCAFKRFEQNTRQEAWNYLYAQRTPMETVTQETLEMIPTLTEECTIGRTGVTIAKLGVSWWAEWMPSVRGEKIKVRYNPEDLSKAWGYEKSGCILGEMGKPHIVPAIIEALPKEEQPLARDALAKAMAAQRMERKENKRSHKSKGINEFDMLEAREFALGIKALDKTTGEVIDNGKKISELPAAAAVTKHDTDMKKLKEHSKYGAPELLDMLG